MMVIISYDVNTTDGTTETNINALPSSDARDFFDGFVTNDNSLLFLRAFVLAPAVAGLALTKILVRIFFYTLPC